MIIIQAAIMSCVLGFFVAASAQAAELTRHWQRHFWIIDKVDLLIDVYQFPNHDIKVSGRFSNGRRLENSEAVGLVYIKTSDGKEHNVMISEWVKLTHGGATNVRFKEFNFSASSSVFAVKGLAYESAKPFEFGVEVHCETDNKDCAGYFHYDELPDWGRGKMLKFSELASFDFCKDFNPNDHITINYAAQTVKYATCHSDSGKLTYTKKNLKHYVPLPSPNGGSKMDHKPL